MVETRQEQVSRNQSVTDYDSNTKTLFDLTSPSQTYEDEQDDSAYEVEKEYDVNDYMDSKSDQADLKPIKSFMPKIYGKPQEKAVEAEKVSVKPKLNSRGIIFASAISAIAIMLVAFVIYNAIAIAGLKTTLNATELAYTASVTEVNTLDTTYNQVSSRENIINSLREENPNLSTAEAGDYVQINAGTKTEVVDVEKTTNVFDKICNFLSNLFN